MDNATRDGLLNISLMGGQARAILIESTQLDQTIDKHLLFHGAHPPFCMYNCTIQGGQNYTVHSSIHVDISS